MARKSTGGSNSMSPSGKSPGTPRKRTPRRKDTDPDYYDPSYSRRAGSLPQTPSRSVNGGKSPDGSVAGFTPRRSPRIAALPRRNYAEYSSESDSDDSRPNHCETDNAQEVEALIDGDCNPEEDPSNHNLKNPKPNHIAADNAQEDETLINDDCAPEDDPSNPNLKDSRPNHIEIENEQEDETLIDDDCTPEDGPSNSNLKNPKPNHIEADNAQEDETLIDDDCAPEDDPSNPNLKDSRPNHIEIDNEQEDETLINDDCAPEHDSSKHCSLNSRSPQSKILSGEEDEAFMAGKFGRAEISHDTLSPPTSRRRNLPAATTARNPWLTVPASVPRPRSSAGRQQRSTETYEEVVRQERRTRSLGSEKLIFRPYKPRKLTITEINTRVLKKLSYQLDKPHKLGHVYLHKHEELEYIKVGSTEEPVDRVGQHQKCNFRTKDRTMNVLPTRGFRLLENLIFDELINQRRKFECDACIGDSGGPTTHQEIFEITWDELLIVARRWYNWLQEANPYDEEGYLRLIWFHKAHKLMGSDHPFSLPRRAMPTSEGQREVGIPVTPWATFTELRVEQREIDEFDPWSCAMCTDYATGKWPKKKKDETRRTRPPKNSV
ncbi:hypothetical protein AJ78_06230 [Emergomyces pasteurianus Ep9510]|uniref:Bacteriophage T5 Orf172 DNA-binding domain-containing protein n=1 Tax=Emergomyces pasteurianus Ep9510 TaxID=1447872 RepID=A0A1J9PBG5_9EURO|nr:hypothetical protein AJ78_06230 [Emergomyces pasteurianus Ep9510]